MSSTGPKRESLMKTAAPINATSAATNPTVLIGMGIPPCLPH
jgi:hypothetical protein